MRKNIGRIQRLEEILSPKTPKSVILDYITSEPQSWIQVNEKKFMIPPEADIEKFVHEKTKQIRGNAVCTLYLAKDRTKRPNADFSGLISKGDDVWSFKGFEGKAE